MPKGLRRIYGRRDLHFVTCSCYRREPLLGTARRRDAFVRVLEQTRRGYRFDVIGYVVMPEHVHLLIGEPEVGNPSTVMQVLKQRSAWAIRGRRKHGSSGQGRFWKDEPHPFWQARFYDFNVWSRQKRSEKLRYMHRNPVKRGLVSSPELWPWSSFRHYATGEQSVVEVESERTRWKRDHGDGADLSRPSPKPAEGRGTLGSFDATGDGCG